MKKVLLIAAVALFGFNAAQAQEEGIRFGAKAGLNIASITGDDIDDVKSKIGLHFGAVVEIPLSEKFAFQPELVYSSQGAKSELSESGAGFEFSSESNTKLSYLNIPLMMKFYVAEGFSLQAGPQLGLLLSSKVDFDFSDTFEGVTETESFDLDSKDVTNGLDLALNFGMGYKLEMGLFFDARYSLGLSNINKSGKIAENDFFDEIEVDADKVSNKNSVISLSIGYKF